MSYLIFMKRLEDEDSENEFNAKLTDDTKGLIIGEKTSHIDPSNDVTLMFSPIKHTDDLINMATQMGISEFLPVITERTVAYHINWERMQKIAIEASEQSNRNSVPKIHTPIRFSELDLKNTVFADERAAYGCDVKHKTKNIKSVLIGPEGDFSPEEIAFAIEHGFREITLGDARLRTETAAVVATVMVSTVNQM